MMPAHPIVFLVDVDNTLLDNDRIQQNLKDHLERFFSVASRDRCWTILESIFAQLGYRDYIRGGRGAYWEDQGYEWYAGI